MQTRIAHTYVGAGGLGGVTGVAPAEGVPRRSSAFTMFCFDTRSSRSVFSSRCHSDMR